MTISETTYRAIGMMLPDEATIEKLGAAYESGDTAELGRLMAAYIGEECRKTDALWSLTVKGLMTASQAPNVAKQFDTEFSRDAGGRL